jgi:diketogulonate reductase-like aldo/keto reductase
MKAVQLPSGEAMPLLGQGTWRIGETRISRAAEIATLRRGIDLDMRLIDTAEMYGDGAAEELVGEAVADCRNEVFLVSKVYPQNAGKKSMQAACEASLKRLGTDRLDLYLLHWRGSVPLHETVEAFERLIRTGKIRHWGVSNFDIDDMAELFKAGGSACATNQVLYNPTRRGPEYDLFPWMAARAMPVMAYSPIEQGRLPASGALRKIADRHGASIMQIALAFTIRSGRINAIPKASTLKHVEDNRRAADLPLDATDLAEIDRAFPPPHRKEILEML